MNSSYSKKYKAISLSLCIVLFLFPSVIYFSSVGIGSGKEEGSSFVNYKELQNVFDPYTDKLSRTLFIKTFISEYSLYADEKITEFVFTFSDDGKISVSAIEDISKTQKYYYQYFV